jgi:hypothetical protein
MNTEVFGRRGVPEVAKRHARVRQFVFREFLEMFDDVTSGNQYSMIPSRKLKNEEELQ